MPVVYVHGVAVRDRDDPEYAAVERLTRGAEWAEVEAGLREHVAPVLRPSAPERVALLRVYWGDLGARRGEAVGGVAPALKQSARPAALTPDELGEALQHELFEALPPAFWPAVVQAVWETVQEPALRAQLAARAPRRQAAWLGKLVRARLVEAAPELGRLGGELSAGVGARSRRGVRWAMGEVRRPLHDVVPTFVGDVLRYLDGRGQPGAPGPIVRRVLDVLAEAGAAERGADEPLVVLSHSMGGQLVYDALTAFGAGDSGGSTDEEAGGGDAGGIPRIDFWCSAGGQLGLFAELGMFLRAENPALVPVPSQRLGYLWNAWSSSDVLSFPAQGRIAGAHDSDFAFTGTPAANHLAYLREPVFYRTLAAKVTAHCRPAPRAQSDQG